MPLRDHFHPPLTKRHSWDELHGGWPMKLVEYLLSKLPPEFYAAPQVHLGGAVEVDIGTFEYDATNGNDWDETDSEGGTATATWKVAKPLLDVEVDLPDTDEYSVRVYDVNRERRLVAAIELVSPANKDRPESKQAFVSKCAALLREEVSVMIVDVVTSRAGNLFADLLTSIGSQELHGTMSSTSIYAGACRLNAPGQRRRLQAWHETLAVGKPLPTLPLWLSPSLELPLDLEVSYEETCRILRMQ